MRGGMGISRMIAAIALLAASVWAMSGPAAATQPGQNGLIAFQVETDGVNEIYVVGPDGQDLRQVTHVGGASTPDWSSDGQWIAFSFHECKIALIRPDGSDLTRIRSRTHGGCETDPAFTPDGTRLVFERSNPARHDDAIWIMDLDGSDRHRLGSGPQGEAHTPEVSPDGQTVTFLSFDREDLTAIYGVRIDGGPVWRVTPDLWGMSFKHDWAPDGSRLVMSDNAENLDRPVNLITIRPDGTGLEYLTDLRGADPRAYAGSYSPDGQWIVYRSTSPDVASLVVVHPDGTGAHTLFSGELVPRFIDWGPAAS